MARRLSEHPAMNGHRMWAPILPEPRRRARYRVHTELPWALGLGDGWWITDRETGLTTYGGDAWADAINQVRARYDRLRRAQDYMTHFHPDQIDADEIIYTPGGWANG